MNRNDTFKTGDIIQQKRKELKLTQNQLAQILNISFQAVSKWENGTAYPDIAMLPKLASILNTTIDALLGYQSAITGYDSHYDAETYYWGLLPNHFCYEIMKILPPVKPYRVLDIGCGEGKDAVFLAKCGYAVTAFDISPLGIEKAKKLALHNKADVCFFKANLLDYHLDTTYDIILSSGVLHYLSQEKRKEVLNHLKEHTTAGGINALNVFVEKPFIAPAPDLTEEEKKSTPWYSGELFYEYHDWLFHICKEEIFDCDSSGIPHQHCMDTLIAQKSAGLNSK